MIQDALQWIVELSVDEGKQEEFEKLAKEMSEMVRRFEPGTRKYEWFLTDKGNKCIIIEIYDSSSSGLAHARGEAIKEIFPKIRKIADVVRFEICGNPSEELLRELDENPPTIYRFASGFSRQ